ncbi:hypothetical protein F4677DRAFT_448294 [Hypoxylon crocopeplum]|nr:hypothetical protein F4677DRAFT_448294 [Hypoxylon crocopeplum]
MEAEIHLFGGQGWSGLFQDRSVAVAKGDVCASPYTRELLDKCHKCLIKDASSLYAEGIEDVAQLFSIFPIPDSLLDPPEQCHSQPVIQGTTLCLFQLLRYLSRVSDVSAYQEVFGRLYGTAGFCSGILPSIVVASSPTIEAFVDNGVQAFRAVFWLGFRAGEYSRRILGVLDTDHSPWTYSLSGLSQARVTQLVSAFNSEAKTELHISIAGILRDSNITVTGSGSALKRFLSQLPTTCVARPVHVNALYHGGERMAPLVGTILNDFQKHKVTLPSFNDLRKVVFSSFDGSKLSNIEFPESPNSLARHVLEMILVKHCDWTSVLRSIDIDQQKWVAVVYGPSPNLLVPPSFVSSKRTLDRLDVSHENAEVQLLSNYRQSEDDIAIVGVGLDLPNGSDLDGFWESLKNGVNCVSRAPDDRFPHQGHVGKSAQATPYHGNFISNPWAFDNALFNISPREAKSMDPQQRVLLQCSFHALQHAGYVADATECFQRSTFGCFVGAATGDYVDRMSRDMDVYYSPGTLRAFLSGRISYCFGHSGPSVVVDTACSSSLVAIHQACKALLAKECNAALAGGVNVICGPDMQRGLARARFLSPTGQCRPFDAAADGYCRAEGCAMFVLKRLPDAIAENDRILGVIKGTGINQSGGADSITHPHAKTQQALFEAVLNQSNILPQSITAAELHGTGTQAGDPVEYESVASVFGSRRSLSSPLIVSSMKGNIGHAEAASGSAGLAKLLMMMANGQVPLQVGFKALNPKIAAIKNNNIFIPKQLLDWPRQNGMPRRALLNNFGAAGSNACLILEEYVDMENKCGEMAPCDSYVFVLSAKDATTLERYRQLAIRNTNLRQMRLCDLAYTSTARRTMFESRLVVKSTSTEQLFQSLESACVSPQDLPCVSSHHQVVFVFSGQGSQYLGMGRDLFETAPQFKKDILYCEHILVQATHPSILPIVQSHSLSTESLVDHGIVATHCAVFAVEYALARLWISWGIRPNALLGHSLGEYAAFVIAGVLSVEDAILIVARRAELVEGLCELGTSSMLSVNDSASKVQGFILTTSPPLEGLTVACDNSPLQCVVSGPTNQLDDLAIAIGAAGTKTRKLDVPFGFHSPAMETIRSPLNDFVAKVQLHKPSIPLGLGLNGRMHSPSDFDHGYFASQAINPIRFRETVEDFLSHTCQNNTICLEIGPHPIVLPMMRAIKPASSTIYLGSLRREKKDWWSINESVSELVRCGFELDFRKIYEGQSVQLVDIPLYPFAQEEFRVAYEVGINAREVLNNQLSSCTSSVRYGSLLSPQQTGNHQTQDPVVYEANQRIEKFIDGHAVAGLPLCPASVYIELALQAARELKQVDAACGRIVVEDVSFSSPLVRQMNQSQPETTVRVALGKAGKSRDRASFRVSSGADGTKQTNCEGFLGLPSNDSTDTLVDTMSARFRGAQQSGQLIKRKMLYETIFPRVVSYSELYQTIDYLELNDSGKMAWGSFRLRHLALLEECVSQPVFVDTLLHAAGFLANCSISASDVCICTKIESINLWIDAVDYTESFRLYTEISSSQKAVVGSSFAYDADGKLVGSIQGITFRRLDKEAFTRSLVSSTKSSGAGLNGLSNHNINHVEYDTIASPGTNGVRLMPVTQSDIGIAYTNGVDKAKLAQLGSDIHFGDEINNAVAEVAGLPIHKVHGETDLQQIGLDSLMAFELLDLLRSRLGLEIPHTEFESCQTPNDIVRLAESVKQPPVQRNGDGQASKSLSLIRRGSDRLPPLYMVHDGSGLCSMYSAISSLGRNLFGISCDEKNQFRTVDDMATAYAGLVDTSKPFILGGWSFGGVVAHEMARILNERHAPVRGVIMIDSPCPTAHDGIPGSILRRVCHGKPDWLLRNFETHTAMLSEHSPPATVTPFPVILLRSAETVGADVIGDGLCPFLSNGVERHEEISLWRGLLGPDLQVLEIAGNHFQAFDENIVAETSRSISQAIGLIEQGPI